MHRFIVGKRLGADEPRALKNVKRQQHRREQPVLERGLLDLPRFSALPVLRRQPVHALHAVDWAFTLIQPLQNF